MTGPLVLDTFQIRLSHILFQYAHRHTADRKYAWTPERLAGAGFHILTVPQDPFGIDFYFEQPSECEICIALVPPEHMYADVRLSTT